MLDDALGALDHVVGALAGDPWALAILFGLVFADAFLVVVPGEIAVTVLGAVALGHEGPPLWAVIGVAAAGAFAGDAACYAVGRRFHPRQWPLMRRPRFRRTLAWAERRLEGHVAVAVFTVRFIPFARLVVNLAAGAARIPASRYLPVSAGAALAWAAYQALVGAAVGAVVPGGPVPAVLVSIVVALALGWLADAAVSRWAPSGAAGR
ncbi:DedA family protein [Microbacterium gilvum]|uniref:VTT domain-containing protein n=1 Tax=Microbacterium gilvum TaxID=1336204 RepID=A0ABP9AFA7_9MICO